MPADDTPRTWMKYATPGFNPVTVALEVVVFWLTGCSGRVTCAWLVPA